MTEQSHKREFKVGLEKAAGGDTAGNTPFWIA